MTTKGMIDLFVLFFIRPQSKRAIISGITANPDSAWVTQQARNTTMTIADLGFPTPDVLIIDHDSKYTKEFDAVWSAEGTRVKRVGPFAPNLNAFAERFAQTLRHECLDHFLILGEKHLRHLLKAVSRALPRREAASIARQSAAESTVGAGCHPVCQRIAIIEGRVPRTARRAAEVIFSHRGVRPINTKLRLRPVGREGLSRIPTRIRYPDFDGTNISRFGRCRIITASSVNSGKSLPKSRGTTFLYTA
jgi:hypothetical protein